jgi:DHA1 family tetracycline resistance protein-like MFS transporter
VGSGLDDSTALVVLLVSRVFAGVCGANITVAQAYVADITPPEQRSKRMGLIGMAFGLGFIFGPALGGQANHWLGMTGPGWVAAGMCAANFLLALAILPESLRPDSVHAAVRPARAQWAQNLAHPQIGLLTAVFFVATFCFACFETTIGLLVSENFNLRVRDDEHAAMKVSNLFVYCGLIGALVQGGAIGRLVRLMGEARLITLSFLLVALSLASLPFVKEWGLLLVVLGVLSIGSSLTRPPLFGLISNLAPAHEQGATLGVAQSAGSLARIPSPVFAATLFDRSHAWPYLACAALLLLVMGLTWRRLRAAEAVSKR